MPARKYSPQYLPRRLSLLSLAITAGLAATLPNVALANQVINSSQNSRQLWTSGDFTVTSTGAITTLNNEALNVSGLTLGVLSNSGTISSTNSIGVYTNGVIQDLSNINAIYGDNYGIYNTVTGWGNGTGSIDTLTNSGSITSRAIAIYNVATAAIGDLSNTGTISGGLLGVANVDAAVIGTLTNSGTISNSGAFGSGEAIINGGTIGLLSNLVNGSISGGSGSNGITTGGTISQLSNSGSISGINRGISSYSGTISALTNTNTGTISGGMFAIYNAASGALGPITNAGTIAGAIQNDSIQDLTILGGSGTNFGRLTGNAAGFGIGDNNIGQITNINSDLIFGAGNQLLNDNINVGGFSAFNLGTLQLNNTIAITGNYSQAADASLILGVADNALTTGALGIDSGYGRLVVSGSANLASGSTVGLQSLGSYGFAQGQRYLVIQADSTNTNYNADTLNYNVAGYNASGSSVVDGSDTHLIVTVGSALGVITPPPSVGPINQATTAVGMATLSGLFNYNGLDAGVMNLFNAAAALGSSAEGNTAGAQLSPTANLSAATQASTASTGQALDLTAARIDSLRGTQNGSSGTGIATGESAATSGQWGQAFGGSSRLEERDDVSGYHARYNGLLLGADGMFNDNWRAGGLFTYTKTTVNNDGDNNGSSADVKSYGLLGYASYSGNPWYLDLSAGAVQHQYETQRRVEFTGFNGTTEGQYGGMQYIASAQAGYPFDLGAHLANIVVTPIAGLTYSTLRLDSYTEKGGNGAALNIDAKNSYSLKSTLGAKVERSFSTTYCTVIPSAQLTWRHEFREAGLQSVANYASDTSGATNFTTTGAKLVEDTGVMKLGVTLIRSQSLSLSANYTLEAASGYTANTGDLQARWEF
ncbi:outer membrane autotransporter barrel domain-containing protein [Pseudomonas peli]|uniref:Outer membrane autotransporter barrel domain-containing protein n=2 Tax=Pseudomonas peli TaxID=592361 RepID=A0AB37ZAT6_9PSED|nr:autotransporter domain-containing protein [Pseudomonas peli]NMZ70688.1 autotransporter domain-containing protein [Pseudomonas peli]SCW72019.1 outer membrane autotransporter barrel domain-containing protein [Pseudomonas peli]